MTLHAAPMRYSEIEPAPELKPWVAAYWHFTVAPSAGLLEHWIPPTGGVSLVFPNGQTAVLVGPRLSPHRTFVQGGDRFWGIHFWPGTAASLLGREAGETREQQGQAQGILADDWTPEVAEPLADCNSEETAAKLLDASLLPRVATARPLDDKVLTAVFRILASDGDLRIAHLGDDLALSARQLRRRFRAVTELTPKELARLQRVRAAAVSVVSTEQRRWVDLAADQGFSDQAHLVREFRQILGLNPVGLSDHLDRIEHGRIVR